MQTLRRIHAFALALLVPVTAAFTLPGCVVSGNDASVSCSVRVAIGDPGTGIPAPPPPDAGGTTTEDGGVTGQMLDWSCVVIWKDQKDETRFLGYYVTAFLESGAMKAAEKAWKTEFAEQIKKHGWKISEPTVCVRGKVGGASADQCPYDGGDGTTTSTSGGGDKDPQAYQDGDFYFIITKQEFQTGLLTEDLLKRPRVKRLPDEIEIDEND